MVESIESNPPQQQESLIHKVLNRIDDLHLWIFYYRVTDSYRALTYARHPKGLGGFIVRHNKSGEVIGDLFGVDVFRGLVHVRTHEGQYHDIRGRFIAKIRDLDKIMGHYSF